MKINKIIFELVLLINLLQMKCSYGAKILGLFGATSRSHFIVEEPLMRELAKRGHEVTVVIAFSQSGEPLVNYRYIELPEILNNQFLSNFASNALQSADKTSSFTKLIKAFTIMKNLVGSSLNFLRHPKFLPLKNEKFDLLIVGWFMNEYTLGLSAHFHCPSVIITPNVNNYALRKVTGNLSIPFYNEEFLPHKYPPFEEALQNLSLVLLTQHFSGHIPEALLPNVIEVEGMHIKKEPSPLPTDIKAFLDNANDGAIFFSLGTNVKSSDLSQENISNFLDTFRGIKQKVIWKFETEIQNLPSNVIIDKWLPQDDILAHPNVKLFISHCGKGGITEAKYHGVPILAVPIFADQFSNAEKIVDEGWADALPLADINAKSFCKILNKMLNNSTYSDIEKKLSNLNRDRPEHPLDKAIFWIEYVIRHNGAKHLQSPAIHLNLLQYYSLDVYCFIIFTFFVIVKIIKILFNVFSMKVFGIKKHKTKKE